MVRKTFIIDVWCGSQDFYSKSKRSYFCILSRYTQTLIHINIPCNNGLGFKDFNLTRDNYLNNFWWHILFFSFFVLYIHSICFCLVRKMFLRIYCVFIYVCYSSNTSSIWNIFGKSSHRSFPFNEKSFQ